MSNEWLPFIESVQKKENSTLYGTLLGGNIIEINDSKLRFIRRGKDSNKVCSFHFSILFDNKVFFFAINNEVLIYENKFIKKISIDNEENEIFIPFIYHNRFAIIGCVTTKRYIWNGEKFLFSNVLYQNDNWGTRRVFQDSLYVNFWSNKNNRVFMYNNLEDRNYVVKVNNMFISDVAESEKKLYVADSTGNLHVYNYYNNKIINTFSNVTDGMIQLIVPYKKKIYLFCNKGNVIYIINEFGFISRRLLNLEEKSNTHWTRLDKNIIYGIVEDQNYDNSYIVEFNLSTEKETTSNYEKMYNNAIIESSNYIKTINENKMFTLSDFLKMYCSLVKDIEKDER